MENHPKSLRYISCTVIILILSATIIPSCIAQAPATTKKTIDNFPQNLFLKKVKQENKSDENFFSFAIVWGPFEVRGDTGPLFALDVHNRAPWYNSTINVLGHQNLYHKWVFKKAAWVTDNFLHVGFVGPHWLFAFCFIEVDAF
jgi:hypothetical protein